MNQKTVWRMPAEWEAHERTLVSWPVKETMANSANYERFCAGFEQAIRTIHTYEPVTVIVNREDEADVRRLFAKEAISVLPIEHDDAWLRDNGPTFLINTIGERIGINWQFNAWGQKWPSYERDNRLAKQLLDHLSLPRLDAPFVLEGGSIHVDGEGTLLTTESCLLHPNRNPDWSKEQLEQALKEFTRAKKVIWLKRGLDGDETDGHVDNVACFLAPGVVLLQVCEDQSDPNYVISQENRALLEKATDARGRSLQIIPIEQPPLRIEGGQRLPLSYINFYFVNGGIVLPLFGGEAVETDRAAVQLFRRLFPNRRLSTIDGMNLICEGGNVHCITQPLPKRE